LLARSLASPLFYENHSSAAPLFIILSLSLARQQLHRQRQPSELATKTDALPLPANLTRTFLCAQIIWKIISS
jgi:hypothetical protein